MATWAGQYKRPLRKRSVHGSRHPRPAGAADCGHGGAARAAAPSIPICRAPGRRRAWTLCSTRSQREGEDRATIDEIIRLSQKYKFVTPYTSFLAVPRALLRPRVIRPGDPVLRLKTDESIVSVIALFPFGLTKPLRYLKQEDTWQTRFLAPVDMADGEYQVRLILRDRDGHVYRESKSFVIASKTPVLRARLDRPRVHAGETLRISAQVSGNARTHHGAALRGAAGGAALERRGESEHGRDSWCRHFFRRASTRCT